jgi:hypothetical protein
LKISKIYLINRKEKRRTASKSIMTMANRICADNPIQILMHHFFRFVTEKDAVGRGQDI